MSKQAMEMALEAMLIKQRVTMWENDGDSAKFNASITALREAIKQHDAEPVAWQDFNKWMHNELPSGTIIGNPGWWASRIYKRFISASPQPTKGGKCS